MKPLLSTEWTDGTAGEWAMPDTPEEKDTRRVPLTVRTIPEILEMKFDDADLILENGYATKGDLTATCGMGGVGKSRLAIQFAFCCRSGRPFLGWRTRGRDLRFLFLQTENSCRRLNSDIAKMLSGFTPEEQESIKGGVFFHTLEEDDDGFLALDAENKQRIEDKITKTRADAVVWDPLRDFSLDDLNSDKFMGETLRDILRVTKRGNPKRLPLVVHHAATGKAGAQKTTGWDRSSFGRNSKVLQMMARAVINVGQAQPDNNNVIIIGSGKCNNAPEFAAFAARLNFETMLYARDDDFDMEGWREEVSGTKPPRKLAKDVLREVLSRGRDYDQKDIVKRVIDEELVSPATAYRIVNEGKTRGILRCNKTTKTYALA
jgi:AAA domain-containing protein